MSTADNIVEFKVDIVDKDGVHVYGANNTLKFHVEGPAALVGPDVYISDRDKHEEYEGTMYIDAPVINLIRAVGKTGTVTVTASATASDRPRRPSKWSTMSIPRRCRASPNPV